MFWVGRWFGGLCVNGGFSSSAVCSYTASVSGDAGKSAAVANAETGLDVMSIAAVSNSDTILLTVSIALPPLVGIY